MANGKQIARGLEILGEALSTAGIEAIVVSAEHEEIFASGPDGDTDPTNMDASAKDELASLGWRWDEELECWSYFT